MSVYNVMRQVDTVTIEMDIANAEALLEVVKSIEDLATLTPVKQIADAMVSNGEIRYPSPLFNYDAYGSCLTNRSREDYEDAYYNEFGTLDVCNECGGKTGRHYTDCTRVL